MEHQRQQLLQERQQFHCEQLRAAEFRQRQLAAQQLLNEGKLVVPAQVSAPLAQTVTPQMSMQEAAVSAPPASSTCASSSASSSNAAPVAAMPPSVSPALNIQQIQQPQQELSSILFCFCTKSFVEGFKYQKSE